MTVSEAQFTRPHADCPHPELWSAADAYSTECEVTDLVAAFVRALQPEYVIETGSCWGLTAKAIGFALLENDHGRLVSLEVDPGKVAHCRTLCEGLPVDILEMPSMEYTPTGPIGFAFFDSLMGLRLPELARFRPWLAAGTTVAFHDTSPHMGKLGADLAGLDWIRTIRLRTPRGITFAEVL